MRKVFIAYPSSPADISDTLERAKGFAAGRTDITIETWKRDDLGGQQLISPIVAAIRGADIVAADVTALNFNVTYELGYGLGLGKRVLPIRHLGFSGNEAETQKIGIYDTLLRQDYATADDAFDILSKAETGQRIATDFPPDPLPLYVLLPSIKTDDISHLLNRGRRAGLRARTFDPSEQPRLSASTAARSVAVSAGVVVPLLEPGRQDAHVHNLRCAFVAGIAHALGKPTLLVKKGDWATPLDIRDEVQTYHDDEGIDRLFAPFAERAHNAIYSEPVGQSSNRSDLSRINLGDPAAENEESQLKQYFLERAEFRQVVEGRTNIVVGRKGSGKTAVYVRTRDQLRENRSNVIVDLSPEAHQLKQLRDVVLTALAAGSKEYLLAAFWEYVLLLEICGKIIEKDQDVHKRNHALFEPYQRLLALFRADRSTEGTDFSDRLLKLIERIASRYKKEFGDGKEISLNRDQLTNLLYETTLPELRDAIETYAREKDRIHILFDNLDKGWNAEGLEDADVVMIRTLLDAGRKLENDFRRSGTDFHCTIFLRNDVFEVLLSQTADRGKLSKLLVDWPQADLLKQIVRRRLIFALGEKSQPVVDALWIRICIPLVKGENSLDYLIRRSLMRPRYLLRLINYCIGNAVDFERNRVDDDDIEAGESTFSTDVITEIDLEIRDLFPQCDGVLYTFLGEPKRMNESRIKSLLEKATGDKGLASQVYIMLLWHGVLGFIKDRSEPTYIFDVNYDLRRLQGSMAKFGDSDPFLEINPAFWLGLEMVDRT